MSRAGDPTRSLLPGVHPGRRQDAGFSLIEMLVSLAVMGMAAWLLTAGIERIALGTQAANRTDNRLDALATAQRLLRQRLTAIEPVTDTPAGSSALDFTGQAQTIDFVGRVADRGAPDALQHYRLQRDADGDLMLLSLSTLDSHGRQSPGWAPLKLLSGTTQISIRYLGQNRRVAEQHAVWQADWADRTSLPMLVRIGVDFAAGDHRQWPDLIVHPRAATPEPCPRDVLTGGCAPQGNLVT